jgi:hypothetical protein
MRIGDRATYTGGRYPWAAGRQVEIKGIVRDYRTIRENQTEAQPGDQVIFSLLDADGFRCSVPDARVEEFEPLRHSLPSQDEAMPEVVRVEFQTLV